MKTTTAARGPSAFFSKKVAERFFASAIISPIDIENTDHRRASDRKANGEILASSFFCAVVLMMTPDGKICAKRRGMRIEIESQPLPFGERASRTPEIISRFEMISCRWGVCRWRGCRWSACWWSARLSRRINKASMPAA